MKLDPEKTVHTTRVYYDDGTMRETLDWRELPNDGVLMVVIVRVDGSRRTMSQRDYYFQAAGVHDYIFGETNNVNDLQRYTTDAILRGKWASDIIFEAARLDAQQ